VISYHLASKPQSAPRISIVNAAGDTVARLVGDQDAGLNSVTWNLVETPAATAQGGAGGGRGGGRGGAGGGRGGIGAEPVNAPGFPAGFNPRPAESRAAPDSSGSPTAPATAGPGRGQGGGRGFGRGNIRQAETGDYRVVLDVDGKVSTQVLRVVRVLPGQVSIMP
jgi:hypothetical protein